MLEDQHCFNHILSKIKSPDFNYILMVSILAMLIWTALKKHYAKLNRSLNLTSVESPCNSKTRGDKIRKPQQQK